VTPASERWPTSQGATNNLPANDDGSSAEIPLPFDIKFFGTVWTSLYANNNGNLTFTNPMVTFTPYPLDSSLTPIIAPFFADVDTRGPSSALMTWGSVTWMGRPTFCVSWDNAGVGYFDRHVDKLNKFQVLLVDRNDVEPNAFDIVFNYDQIQWETGDASDGVMGLGGSSARAGYSDGNTLNPDGTHELPGSAVPGSFLDGGPNALISGSHGSNVPGRYIFEIRSPPGGYGTLDVLVTDSSNTPLGGAPVQVCKLPNLNCGVIGLTDQTGHVSAEVLLPDLYRVTAFPPSGTTWNSETAVVSIPAAVTTTRTLALSAPLQPPATIDFEPNRTADNGIPRFYTSDTITMTVSGCVGGLGTVLLIDERENRVFDYEMAEGPPGTYSVTIPPPLPATGPLYTIVDVYCSLLQSQTADFNIYIDPSGHVEDLYGRSIVGAAMTLLRSDTFGGPLNIVPDQSYIMSPSNRDNPSFTDGDGYFAWDVIAGYYVVQATRSGCHSPDDSSVLEVETELLTIPPPVTDLVLTMDCPLTGTLVGTCPGPVSVDIGPLTPGGQFAILAGPSAGSFSIPSGHCAGYRVPLAAPQLVSMQTAPPSGRISLAAPFSQAMCNRTWAVVDMDTCEVSQAFRVQP
jgi:hypothetical protein